MTTGTFKKFFDLINQQMVGKNTYLSINTRINLPYMMVCFLYFESRFLRTQLEVTTKYRCDKLSWHSLAHSVTNKWGQQPVPRWSDSQKGSNHICKLWWSLSSPSLCGLHLHLDVWHSSHTERSVFSLEDDLCAVTLQWLLWWGATGQGRDLLSH